MDLEENRDQLIHSLRMHGITDETVLNAMLQCPRELFVEQEFQDLAYVDRALPITCGQTISQPYVVALMTQVLLNHQQRLHKVLEVGTGSGYQAAVLSLCANVVYSVERIKSLYEKAKERIEKLKIENVFLLHGDGFLGWPEHGPFDGIIVTAAAEEVPSPLLEQLKDGGRLVIPVDYNGAQALQVITRKHDQYISEYLEGVLFVPLLRGKVDE